MKNLSEQLNRIKTLMLIKEQCGGDLEQCEEDLESSGYKVFSPTESENICDSNDNIKCVKQALSDVSGRISIASAGNTVEDCFVLVKSNHTTSGIPTFHLTFYSDNQLILTFLLNPENGSKKLMYRSKYECNGTDIKIKGGTSTFKYIGVFKGGSSDWENPPFKKKDGSGSLVDVTISSSESSSMNIPSGILKFGDTLTYYLNKSNIVNGNVLNMGMDKTEILKLLQH